MLAVNRYLMLCAINRVRSHVPVLILLATATGNCLAVLPPRYLGIEKFDQCLAEKRVSTFRVWCMPEEKPQACPRSSWKQLRALKGREAISPCAEKIPSSQ